MNPAAKSTALVGTWLRPLEEWTERHPRRAWAFVLTLVLAAVAVETAWWPLNDFPGAMWHHNPRGEDIELAQARAATAGWRELAGYWYGRMIHGHGYYRPLASWLFVAEYRLFGTNDRAWAWINIGAHLATAALLAVFTSLCVQGSRLRRLGTGALAALIFGAPGLADREVQFWTTGWWPCQPEIFSLLFGLGLAATVAMHTRTGETLWARLAPPLLFLAVCFKEMGYVAGIGACLILAGRPRQRRLLAALAALGICLFVFRAWALKDAAGMAGPRNWENIRMGLGAEAGALASAAALAAPHAALLAAGGAAAWALRRRWGLPERIALAAALYLCLSIPCVGLPWEVLWIRGARALIGFATGAALLGGLVLACRRRPVPELAALAILSQITVAGFNPIFGWYWYWSTAFGAAVQAVAIGALLSWGFGRAAPPLERAARQPG